jgi:hypothetical protein
MCASWVTRHTSIQYSEVNGQQLDFYLHRHPVSVNCLYHARMVLSVGGSFPYFTRNARCTVTTDLLRDIPTHKTTSPTSERPFSRYIHSHRLAAEMWTTIKKQLTGEKNRVVPSICTSFDKYVSYGFPIIIFCNPGVHYKTSCISLPRHLLTFH